MMGATMLDREQVTRLLKMECVKAGGQKVWAARHHLSPQYVWDVLKQRRELGPSIMQSLGLKKVVVYVR